MQATQTAEKPNNLVRKGQRPWTDILSRHTESRGACECWLLFYCCDKTLKQKQLKEEELVSGSRFQEDRGFMARLSAEENSFFFLHTGTREGENRKQGKAVLKVCPQ